MQLKWEETMEAIGKALDPVVKRLADFANTTVLPAITSIAEAFEQLPVPLREAAVGLALVAAAIVPLALAIGGLGVAFNAAMLALAPYAGFLTLLIPLLATAAIAYAEYGRRMTEVSEKQQKMSDDFGTFIDKIVKSIKTEEDLEAAQKKVNAAEAAGALTYAQAASALGQLAEKTKEFTDANNAAVGSVMTAQLEKMGVSLHLVSNGMDVAAARSRAHGLVLEALRAEVKKTETAFMLATEQLHNTGKGTEQVTKTYKAHEAAIKELETAEKGHIAKLSEAEKAVKSLGKAAELSFAKMGDDYDEYTANLEKGGQTAKAALGQIEGEIIKASLAMEGMKGKPAAAMQALIDRLTELQTRVKEFADQDAWNTTVTKVAAMAGTYEKHLGGMDEATLNWINECLRAASEVPAAFNKMSAEELAKQYLDALKQMDEATKKWSDSSMKAMAAMEKQNMAQIPILVALSDRIRTVNVAVADYLDMVVGLNKEGIKTIQQEEAHIKTLEALLASTKAANQSLSIQLEVEKKLLEAKLKKAQAEGQSTSEYVAGLARVNAMLELEAASTRNVTGEIARQIVLDQEVLAIMVKRGAGEEEILRKQQQIYDAKIRLKEISHEAATEEIVASHMLELRQQAQIDLTHLEGDTINAMADDAIKGFVGMGDAITTVIFHGGKMGEAIVADLKKIAETMVKEVITGALKAFVDMVLVTVIPTAAKLSTGPIAATAAIVKMQAAMTAATASMSANIATLQAQFSALATTISGAGTAQQGAGAAKGGFGGGGGKLGAAGDIAGIVGAISSIFGNFQMAHIETSLNAVEHNTRYLQIEAEKYFQTDEWDRHYGLLEKLDSLWDSLVDILVAVQHASFGEGGGGGGGTGPGAAIPRTPASPGQRQRPDVFTMPGRETVPAPAPGISLAGLEPAVYSSSPAVAAAGTSAAPGAMATAAQSITKAASSFSSVASMVFDQLVSLPHYAGGGYVPYDMLAHLDAGEFVVPREGMLAASSSNTIGNVTIQVNGAQDPRETARQIANILKTLQPRLSPHSV